jgi:hypothetical protein
MKYRAEAAEIDALDIDHINPGFVNLKGILLPLT